MFIRKGLSGNVEEGLPHAMETLFGFVGDGFSVVVSDCSQVRSIVAFKHDEDKMVVLDEHKVLAATGENADRVAFTEFIQRNMALDVFRTGITKSSHATAHMIRRELATALRKGPYNVSLLLAGYDGLTEVEKAEARKSSGDGSADGGGSGKKGGGEEESGVANLYWMDYMGTLQRVNYGAHGYAAYFISATLDRHWKPGMTEDEAQDLLQQCILVLRTRFLVHQPKFLCRIVSKEGVKSFTVEGSSDVKVSEPAMEAVPDAAVEDDDVV